MIKDLFFWGVKIYKQIIYLFSFIYIMNTVKIINKENSKNGNVYI